MNLVLQALEAVSWESQYTYLRFAEIKHRDKAQNRWPTRFPAPTRRSEFYMRESRIKSSIRSATQQSCFAVHCGPETIEKKNFLQAATAGN